MKFFFGYLLLTGISLILLVVLSNLLGWGGRDLSNDLFSTVLSWTLLAPVILLPFVAILTALKIIKKKVVSV